jgi:hypothetical protein
MNKPATHTENARLLDTKLEVVIAAGKRRGSTGIDRYQSTVVVRS